MTKSTITREQLEEWVAQFDEDGGCDATDRQLEALIRQSLAAMDSDPAIADCDPEVYEKGVSVCLVVIPKETAEVICKGISAATGCKVDWHYIGGRVHIKALQAAPQPAPVVDSEPVGEFYEDGPLNWYQISDGDRVPAHRRIPLYRHAQPAPAKGLELAGWQFKSVNGGWLGLIDENGKNQAIREGCEIREVFAMADGVNERKQVRREPAEWSQTTLGNVGPIGPLKHLSKEALEAAAEPCDLSEWADMQFLLWDAQRRAGITDEQITLAMIDKLAVNKQRSWPEPKDGEPRLHIKEQPRKKVDRCDVCTEGARGGCGTCIFNGNFE